jgi:TolB-like protein
MTKIILATAVTIFVAGQQTPAPQQPPPQQPTEVATTLPSEGNGQPPRLAVPDFIALSTDAETVAIAKIIGQVLWDDLNYEREFLFIPRDVYATVPNAASLAEIPFDRWRELNADGLVTGTVQKTGNLLRVEVRVFNVRGRQSVFGKVYSGSPANPRSYAHMAADEIYQTQRALKGVAESKLTFVSDRDGERMGGTVERRDVKEIYISDYDGERQQRVTVGKTLNVFPRWSPNGRSIATPVPPRIRTSSPEYLRRMTRSVRGQREPAGVVATARTCFASPREAKATPISTSSTATDRLTGLTVTRDNTRRRGRRQERKLRRLRPDGNPQIYVISSDGVARRSGSRPRRAMRTSRRGRRSPTTRSPTPREPARATTSRSSTWRRER